MEYMEALLLKRIEQLESTVSDLSGTIGAAASEVNGGVASPEGSVIGLKVGQHYTQFVTVGDGSPIEKEWVFKRCSWK
jgi:hypothetical protein